MIPDGYEGITTIINFLLDAINDTISDRHNQPRGLKNCTQNCKSKLL